MPSTVVHVGLAGMMGAVLLGDRFDTRAILFVMAATAAIDLDTLIGMYWTGTHRAALHNVFVVLVPAIVLFWDVRLREESYVLNRWGTDGYRVAWVTLVTVLVAHILLDAFYNGANLFWPVHDQFFDLSGSLLISNQEGLVQTFTESTARGTTADTHYWTGFDPGPDAPPDTERQFYLAERGELFVVSVAGYLSVGYRIWEDRRDGD